MITHFCCSFILHFFRLPWQPKLLKMKLGVPPITDKFFHTFAKWFSPKATAIAPVVANP